MDSGNLVLIFFGSVVGGAGVVRAWRLRRLRAGGVRARGTVVRLERRYDDGAWTYTPAIAYVDESGGRHEFTAAMSGSRPVHRVGEEVPVLYLPGRPETAWLNSARHNAYVLGVLLTVGAVAFTAGLLL